MKVLPNKVSTSGYKSAVFCCEADDKKHTRQEVSIEEISRDEYNKNLWNVSSVIFILSFINNKY